ncbi:Hpt domain-containing protein [Chelativorans sp. AA-79]|uniref:Hpt domain-containing protein n=1 Tax=Chelativorans sp. AA-79 TaxID=3028735 RepID=UPI0023F951A0|nr:Hpt domain-containing protein [Chelativorans sp. AA-79]WEX07428.1 Hpt domain-containing protein [Chelativorans sp. AA-79]
MSDWQNGNISKLLPIDLAHLSRQTLGDESLKREVLGLFLVQATAARTELAQAKGEARRSLAHRLVGSARAVGAFAIAACAAELEASPQSEAAAEQLPLLIDEMQLFLSEQMG